MNKNEPRSMIDDKGLRYKMKKAGSPFKQTYSSGTATMSCFLCGKHRERSVLTMRQFIGKNHPVCKPNCADLEVAFGTGR